MATVEIKTYVVYYCERMRDGQEEGGRVVMGLENALAFAAKIRNGFAGDNTEVRIFELGKEIQIEQFVEEEAVVTKKEKVGFKIKK